MEDFTNKFKKEMEKGENKKVEKMEKIEKAIFIDACYERTMTELNKITLIDKRYTFSIGETEEQKGYYILRKAVDGEIKSTICDTIDALYYYAKGIKETLIDNLIKGDK